MNDNPDKVVYGNFITRLDIPAQRVIDNLPTLESIVVLGYDEDGEEYFASSVADGGTVLWLMEKLKKKLLEIGDD